MFGNVFFKLLFACGYQINRPGWISRAAPPPTVKTAKGLYRSLMLKLLQPLDPRRVIGVQLDGLLIILNRKLLVAVLHVGFAEAVINIE
jgi:hypothetical protein